MCYRFTYTIKITDPRIAAGAGPQRQISSSTTTNRYLFFTASFMARMLACISAASSSVMGGS